MTDRANDLDALAALVEETERGVVLAGGLDGDTAPVIDLARAAGWPLLAEPMSGLRRPGAALRAGQALIGDEGFAAAHRPDVVLQVGGTPTTRTALAFGERAERLVIVEQEGAPASAGRRAWRTVEAEPSALARALPRAITPRGETSWLRSWSEADTAARAALDAALDSWDEPFEGRVARDLASAIPDGSVLFAGSSMPVRDLDCFMAPREGLRVLANRGASGIDGLVSTALGIASTGVPTFALIGDLALLHDAGALLWSKQLGIDVTLVVPNNNGGGIFDALPQVGLPEHERLFVTPHDLDLAALAASAGARHVRITHAADLTPAALEDGPGVRLIEIPIDRALAVQRRSELRTLVARALGARS